MTTPLPALATVDDLAGRLGLAVPSDGLVYGSWDGALIDASNALRDAIGQPLTPGTSTLRLEVNELGFVLIPLNPVVAVTAIVDPLGVTLPSDGTAYQVFGQRINFLGQYFPLRPWASIDPIYQVTVQHGWSPVPGEILRWVFALAAAQIANAAVGSLGLNGGANSVAIDDGKVTFADVAGMIPPRAQARLKAMYGGEQ